MRSKNSIFFIETHLCKLWVILRSRVLQGVYVLMKVVGRRLPLVLASTRVNMVISYLCRYRVLRRICAVQIQTRKHVLDHADHTALIRQHDLQPVQIKLTRDLSACLKRHRSWLRIWSFWRVECWTRHLFLALVPSFFSGFSPGCPREPWGPTGWWCCRQRQNTV